MVAQKKRVQYALAAIAYLFVGCHEKASSQTGGRNAYESDNFKTYWYAGKAEIASYRLDQARYGENHPGSAVLIFVTEPFSPTKQVKTDHPGNDDVTVLKLNFTKKFVTGIYPYSMMCSVFTPVQREQFPHSLKVTMSAQEWCGHVFTQMNLAGNEFNVHTYSYFESDGDTRVHVKKALLEDEIWNLIRLDPRRLPRGAVQIIPGLFFTRLMHNNLGVLRAEASRQETGGHVTYTLSFRDQPRSLAIQFEKEFPHKILGWTEQFTAHDGTVMTTKATLDKTLHTDYWTKNKSEFRHLRDSLGLGID